MTENNKKELIKDDNIIDMGRADISNIGALTSNSRRLYKYIVDEFGIDDDASKDLLCESLLARDRLREIRGRINEMGIIIEDRWGCPKSNPLLSFEKDARAQYFRGMQQLNLDIGIEED